MLSSQRKAKIYVIILKLGQFIMEGSRLSTFIELEKKIQHPNLVYLLFPRLAQWCPKSA